MTKIMALTKEELDSIQLPLSDEDYKMLRREEVRGGYSIWSLASTELREAFDKKEAERKDDIPPKNIWKHFRLGRVASLCDIDDDDEE